MAQGIELGAAYVSILPSTRGLAQQLNRELQRPAEQAAKQAGDAIEEGISGGAQRGTQRAGTAIAGLVGSGAVLAGLNKARDAASDLQQAVGGTAAVFGEASEAVDEFADGAAQSVGLSERAAREATSKIGALFKGFGFAVDDAAAKAIELTTIGADLAATFGGTTAEAVDALAAALRGETDPIERYGISLRQTAVNAEAVRLGLADTTTAVDGQAKASATLALITDQASDSMGQFAREADSAAGSAQIATAESENAAASLGDALLPISTKVAEALGFIAQAFQALPGPAQTAIVALAGIVVVAGPINTAITLWRNLGITATTTAAQTTAAAAAVTASATNSAASVGSLYASTGKAATATAGLSRAVGAAGAAAAVAAVGFALYSKRINDAEEAGRAFAADRENAIATAQTFDEFVGTLGRVQDGIESLRETGQASNVVESIIDSDDNAALQAGADGLEELKNEYANLLPVIDAFVGQGVDQDEATRRVLGSVDAVTQALADGYTPEQAAAVAAVEARQRAEEAAQVTTEAFGTETRNGAEAAEEYADALNDAVDALRDTFDLQTEIAEIQIGFRESLRAFSDIQADVNDGTLTGAERVDTLAEAILRGRDAIVDNATALAEQGTATDEIIRQSQAMADELLNVADQAGLTGDEVAFLAADYGLLPEQIETTIETNLDEVLPQIEAIRAALEAFGGGTLDLQLNDDRFGRRAGGGPVFPGTWLVGEEGPEILTLDRSGFVFNARESEAMLAGLTPSAGGGLTQQFHVADIGPLTLEKLRWAARDAAEDAQAARSLALAGG